MAIDPVADALNLPEAVKPKRKRKVKEEAKDIVWSGYIKLSDFPLLPEDKVALKKAVAELADDKLLAAVEKQHNVSAWSFVGDKQRRHFGNRICHAEARHAQTVSFDAKANRPVYNYRYMVQWTNGKVRGQYNGGEARAYTEREDYALTEMLDWLRNRSHWSRFFVGPTCKSMLRSRGTIIDMSTPNFIVHLLAVAWRISGENPQLPVTWMDLVELGCEPHLAFAMCQRVTGFAADDEEGAIRIGTSSGHTLLPVSSVSTMAMMSLGLVYSKDKNYCTPARQMYTNSSNDTYTGRGNNNWLAAFPDALKDFIEKPDPYSSVVMKKVGVIPNRLFKHQWSPGWLWIYQQIADCVDLNKLQEERKEGR